MYTTDIFETAMISCGYRIDKIKYINKSAEVRQVIGRVKIPKKVTINGVRKATFRRKSLRWDATGHCFSLKSNVRQRNYDLPLQTIAEWKNLEIEKKKL